MWCHYLLALLPPLLLFLFFLTHFLLFFALLHLCGKSSSSFVLGSFHFLTEMWNTGGMNIVL